MIIVPPEEIRQYITVDEDGKWIHDPNMPIELEDVFNNFKEEVIKAKEYKKNM
jgi:hypothetical protein